MSFLFEEENLDLDFGTGEDVVETDDVDMGELEESYCEFITSCAALNEAAMIQEAKLLRESADEDEALEEGVVETLKTWWKKFVDFCKRMWAKITAFFSRVWDKIRNLFISDEKWLEENAKALASVDFKPFKMKVYAKVGQGKLSEDVKSISEVVNAVAKLDVEAIATVDGAKFEAAAVKLKKVKDVLGEKKEVSITPAVVKSIAADMPKVIAAGKTIKNLAGPLSKIMKVSEKVVEKGNQWVQESELGKNKKASAMAKKAAAGINKALATVKDTFGKVTTLMNGYRSHGMKVLHAAVHQPKKESGEFAFNF